ncbi:MAG: argininosuccinate lyase, partial [Thermoleophilia bacterium]|nr:argininosuccinate lyase [Thermoleophilia bacterium]
MADGHLGVGGRLTAGPSDELVRAGYGTEAAAGPALAVALSRSDLAHAIALIEGGALDPERGSELLRGLLELDAIAPHEFPWDPAVGDAFQNREKELTARVGSSAAGWLSAGRPRREPFRVALRLVTAEGLARSAAAFSDMSAALATQAKPLAGSLAADYTYLQPAQPTTIGHLLLTWAYPVLRSAERYRRVQGDFAGSVAGVGGSAGSRWPINRERLADLLGHARVE